jgi:hypothetical protein
MTDSKQASTTEKPAGGMGPHTNDVSDLPEEGTTTDTTVQPDGGLGPHANATTSGNSGGTVTA